MVEWFDREIGEPPMREELDGSVLMVFGEPDWIRLPPELGGAPHRVDEVFAAPCPACGDEHVVKHTALEGTDVRVAECERGGFLFYQLRTNRGDVLPGGDEGAAPPEEG